jgi:hypothetical protein
VPDNSDYKRKIDTSRDIKKGMNRFEANLKSEEPTEDGLLSADK